VIRPPISPRLRNCGENGRTVEKRQTGLAVENPAGCGEGS
jgi:hypothetical protein